MIAMSRKIFIHIGSPKTATTTLQSALIQKVPGSLVQKGVDKFIRERILSPNFHKPGILEKTCDEFLAMASTPETEPLFVSAEGLMGPPVGRGKFFPRILSLHAMIQYYTGLGHEVHILFVPRKPAKFLESWYVQMVSTGHYAGSFAHFVDTECNEPFSWSWVTNMLRQTSASVTVLPYEMLLQNKELFVEALNVFFQYDGLFSIDNFGLFYNKTISEESMKAMQIISQIKDKALVRKLELFVRDVVDGDRLDHNSGGNFKRPYIAGALLRRGVEAALEPADILFRDTDIPEEYRSYYA
ncbi:hypothetical protein [Insolitispirillum peregrinum]|nr:hypothetical protein [Insolitispirillum peregrinum]